MAGGGLPKAGLRPEQAFSGQLSLPHLAAMKLPILIAAAAMIASPAFAAPVPRHAKPRVAKPSKAEGAGKKGETAQPQKEYFSPTEVWSTGTVTVGGQPIAFVAVAGTLVVHAQDWSDTDAIEAEVDKAADKDKNAPKPEASMFYTAYLKQGAPAASRPITFLFNGRLGS